MRPAAVLRKVVFLNWVTESYPVTPHKQLPTVSLILTPGHDSFSGNERAHASARFLKVHWHPKNRIFLGVNKDASCSHRHAKKYHNGKKNFPKRAFFYFWYFYLPLFTSSLLFVSDITDYKI
uniref:Uncharacterized protein n=1 Tax=Ixodes ricinus TaxID=34613 RepID=A0A6B0UNA4_IXORI